MASASVETFSGESFTGLAAMIGGAVFGKTVAAMTIGRLLPEWGEDAQTALLGAGVAYFGSGLVRKAGQGAFVYGLANLAATNLTIPGAKAASEWVSL